MVIAAGPRIVSSSNGADPVRRGRRPHGPGGLISFNVTFDRPINPPSEPLATFTTADIQVFYHDTTNGDSSIPLLVTSVTPVASSGVGPGDKFGYTEFTVTFDDTHQPNGGPSGIANFTGTYSYLIAPDDGANNPIVSPIDSFTDTLQPQVAVVTPTDTVNLPIPSKGTGGTGTNDDLTISTIASTQRRLQQQFPNIANQVITGVTLT